jgi:hypothetical protein
MSVFDGYRTLPEVARTEGVPLDPLRELLRKRAGLAALAVTAPGHVRVFDRAAVETILAAFNASRKQTEKQTELVA